jgi:phospholipid/cholesterol/gamma-HCH transport system substrate-binding protein
MEKTNTSIGLFVVGGLALVGAGMFLIGDRHQAFAQHIDYYCDLVNLAGLPNGAKVRVGGMDAGRVIAIGVPDSPSSRFRVKWRIDTKLRGLIRTDSVATVDTEGIVGDAYLSVRPGSAQALQAAALATIPSKEPLELSALLDHGAGLLNDAQVMLKEVGGKLGVALDGVTSTVSNVNDVVVGLKGGRGTAGMLLTDQALADRIRQTVTSTASDVQDIVAGLKQGRGAAGMLLRDNALPGQIQETVRNAQQATADLNHASRNLDALLSDLNSRQIPKQTSEVMDKLNDTLRQVHEIVSDINKPDERGVGAGANIRESLANANDATSNLAEGTEALKRNFFVRGFFKKRGYYTLAHLAPEKYRRDRTFTSRTNLRAWLSGTALFQNRSNGEEELSAQGKTLLNATLKEYGDSVIESPVVIEGYSNGADPGDQLRLSLSRAVLVRQYLQSRFPLDPNNVGIVPMKNSPPDGMERATWDGICIVLVKRG